MKCKLSLLAISTLTLLLLACQDAGPLLPQLDSVTNKQQIKSLPQGSQVKPGQEIPVELVTPTDGSTRPDSLVIKLYAAADSDNSKPLAVFSPSQAELASNRIPSLILPELPAGSYKLVFHVSGNGNVARDETITFFYGPETWGIGNVFTYPGTLLPGGEGLLDLVATVPEGSSAWVRWSQGNEVLKSGLVVDGRDRLQFQSKDSEGIYPITVEIFPQAPESGKNYSFRSPYSRDVQLVVSRGNQDSVKAQDADYRYRFHFTGSLADSGRLAQTAQDQGMVMGVAGQRRLETANEVLGYKLGAGNAFRATVALLPDLATAFQPFALYLRCLPLAAGAAELLSSENRDANAGIRIKRLAGGQIEVHAWAPGWNTLIRSDEALPTDRATEITFALARTGQSVEAVLDTGNEKTMLSAVAALPAISLGPQKVNASLELGAKTGQAFIIDEFGLFQPADSRLADWDAYYLLMLRRYGAALRFAQDFLADVLPAGLKTEGDVRTSQGSLLVPAGASVSLPPVRLDNPGLHLELRFASVSTDKNTSLVIEGEGMPTVSIGFDGVVRQGDRTELIPAMNLNPLSCSLIAGNGKLSLQSAEFDFPVTGFRSDVPLTIRLVRTGKANSALALISIVGREARQTAINLEP